MKVDKLEKENLIRVQEIAKLTWPDTFKNILSSDQIEYMLDLMYNVEKLGTQFDEGHLFYILVREGVDIGFIGLQHGVPSMKDTKLHKIYVLPSAQGLGAGRILMQKAESKAIENKSESLFLNVNRFNKATDFYIKLGFEIMLEENIDIGRGYLMEDFVMKKNLI